VIQLIPCGFLSFFTRQFSQVRTWFSNTRAAVRAEQLKRDLPHDPVISAVTADGVTIKFRPEGLELCKPYEWSDDLFEGVVNLYYCGALQ
jgi:hypothetical protein